LFGGVIEGFLMKNMKILHINTEKTYRGGERQTIILIKALKEKGIDSTLLCRENYPLSKIAERDGINIIRAKGVFESISALILNSSRHDIIHSHAGKAQGIAAIARLFVKTPHVYTRRVVFKHRKKYPTILKYNFTDKVVCVSKAVKEVLLSYGIADRKLAVIYDAVPKKSNLKRKRAEELLKSLNIPADKKIVGNIGALTREKNHKTILLAAREVKDAYFLIFGDGKLRDKLQQLIRHLNLQDRVFLVGFKDNVEDFFLIFDIFVMSSLSEGLSNVVLDAFLYKVPVITTAVGGLKELVFDNYSGMLVPVNDYNSMAEKIIFLLKNRDIAQRLSSNAYRLVEEKFNLERMTSEYIDVYMSLLRK